MSSKPERPPWISQIERASRPAWLPLARAVWGEQADTLLNGSMRVICPHYLQINRTVNRQGGEGAGWHVHSCGVLVIDLFDRRLLEGDAALRGEPRIEIHNVSTRSLDGGDRSVKPLVRHVEIPGIELFPDDPIEGEVLVVRMQSAEGFAHRMLVRVKSSTADAPPGTELLSVQPFGSLHGLVDAYSCASEELEVADVRERYRRRRQPRA